MAPEFVSSVNAIEKNVSKTQQVQLDLLAQSSNVDPAMYSEGGADVTNVNSEIASSTNGLAIERYSTTFGRIMELTGIPEAQGAADTMTQELGGLRVRAEKGNLSSDLTAEVDPMKNDIVEGFRELVQKSIVYQAFWGTVRKTQTEFKQMSHGN